MTAGREIYVMVNACSGQANFKIIVCLDQKCRFGDEIYTESAIILLC